MNSNMSWASILKVAYFNRSFTQVTHCIHVPYRLSLKDFVDEGSGKSSDHWKTTAAFQGQMI